MRNISNKIALRPRNSQFSISSPAVFYKLHEGAGSTATDALGKGGAFTLAGSGTGTPWANVGFVTPDGTNHYLQRGSDAHLRSIFRLDQAFGHIFQALDFYWDGGQTGLEALTFIGKSDNIVGGWGVEVNASSQVVLTVRGVGGSNHADNAFNGFTLASLASQRVQLTVETVYKTATTVDAYLYANGASVSSISNVSLVPNSATAPFGSIELNLDTQGYTLLAQPNGTNARARLGNSAASNCRISRFWASRHETYDSSLGLKLAKDLYLYPGELPICMTGR